MKLVAPDNEDMWLGAEGYFGVAGFTRDGDILLPAAAISKCDAVLTRIRKRNTDRKVAIP